MRDGESLMAPHVEPKTSYRPPSVLLDEDAPERWIFLDYRETGRVVLLTRPRYESMYRPDPGDQG